LTYEPTCSNKNCPPLRGECIEETCLCGAGYSTIYRSINTSANIFSDSNFEYCNYEFKYRSYALKFEAVLPFGVGHFYTYRYLHALVKFLIFWFLSFNKVIFKKNIRYYPFIEKMNSILLWIFSLLYLIDLIGFQFNYYQDGNGVNLI